jgi:hypothetical protein
MENPRYSCGRDREYVEGIFGGAPEFETPANSKTRICGEWPSRKSHRNFGNRISEFKNSENNIWIVDNRCNYMCTKAGT